MSHLTTPIQIDHEALKKKVVEAVHATGLGQKDYNEQPDPYLAIVAEIAGVSYDEVRERYMYRDPNVVAARDVAKSQAWRTFLSWP